MSAGLLSRRDPAHFVDSACCDGIVGYFVRRGDREKAGNAYGSNGARLRSLKRRFDPDGVFAFRDSVARPALSCEGVEEPHHWSSVADTAVRTPLLFAPRHDSSGTAKRKR